MKKKPEQLASEFYNSEGWETNLEGNTLDADKWEDLRDCSEIYLSRCRKRLNRHIPKSGELFMDLGSGPIQYDEYLQYSKNFQKRHCVDLSENALKVAKKRAENVETFCGSFFDLDFEEAPYDCVISQHVIYHMHKEDQSKAIDKIINITKKKGKIVIVYGNPNSLFEIPYKIFRIIKRILRFETKHDLYHHTFPLNWWYQFSDKADVEIYPWRTFNAFYLKKLIPDNFIGKTVLRGFYAFEENLPRFLTTRIAQYPTIVLTKK